MSKKEEKLLKKILSQPLTETETAELTENGFSFKKPTKQTLIFVALYKKAAAGDMNAIKEIRNILSERDASGEGITIIDDVGN